MLEPSDQVSKAQRERLIYIDFCLEFFGQISRADLIAHFNIATASCTRDFSLYKKLAVNNLILRHQTKLYYRTANFKPVFVHDPEQALVKLCAGVGIERFIKVRQNTQYCFDAIRLVHPRSDILASLMRAISANRAIVCDYVSLSSGLTKRELIPHSLINNGHRWHVRAFDRKSTQFRDFVCSRFLEIDILDQPIEEHEADGNDMQWHTILSLQIIAHPRLAHPRAIELDYTMKEGLLELPVRAAIVGYLAHQWRIDCSENHHLDPQKYHLALQNHAVLKQIDYLNLIPGGHS